jgi:penicillin-binding protein 1A
VVSLDQISQDFLDAVVALEDDDFYSHHGLSKRGILRALVTNILQGGIQEGASTITQQLAKNLFFSYDRTWTRKIKELFVALQLERQFSKDRLLEAYVNQIPFGSGIFGVELAAQTYFGKHADELTLAESALLAGVPNLPYRYNPYKNYDAALQRQQFVLYRMQTEGFVSSKEAEQAASQQISLRSLNMLAGHADYFVEDVKTQTSEWFGDDAVNYGGLHIHTTMNLRYQYEAVNAVRDGMRQLDERLGLPSYEEASWEEKSGYPQVAMVVLDPHTGAVRALVGGRDFRATPFNRAFSGNRHAGSAFKPFVYLSAIDKRVVTPTTVLVDSKTTFETPGGPYTPDNFDRSHAGPMTLKWALTHSVNVISVKLMNRVGPEEVANYAKRLGISTPVETNLSLALGTTGVSPVEMAQAYGTLASQGIRRDWHMVQQINSNDNEVLKQQDMTSRRVVDRQSCYQIIDMLKSVIDNGTGRSVRSYGFNAPCAGKTGTSSNFRDSWFVGFTPDLVAAVWVGYDDDRPMKTPQGVGITGASGALPIWARFMKRVYRNRPETDFPIPPGIEFKEVDPRTGAGPLPDGPSISVAMRLRNDSKVDSLP